jgi:hypothetical protein
MTFLHHYCLAARNCQQQAAQFPETNIKDLYEEDEKLSGFAVTLPVTLQRA